MAMRRRFMMQEKGNIKPYMHIEALEDGLIVELLNSNVTYDYEFYYSLDGSTWEVFQYGTTTPAINTGDKIYFKGKVTKAVGIGHFILSKRCNAGGNVMSLLFGDDFENQYSLSGNDGAFSRLFDSCNTLISVSDNFLPATVLSPSCYSYMFYGCTSLKKAPELPATTLVDSCYFLMFYGCTNLNYIKMLATDISATNCLYDWVSGVASTGTFVKNPTMTSLPTGDSGIPSGWAVVNDGVELISFTIQGTEYQAEEGMTWGEWVESEYNTDGYAVDEYDDSIVGRLWTYVATVEDYVYSQDIIIEGYTYLLMA